MKNIDFSREVCTFLGALCLPIFTDVFTRFFMDVGGALAAKAMDSVWECAKIPISPEFDISQFYNRGYNIQLNPLNPINLSVFHQNSHHIILEAVPESKFQFDTVYGQLKQNAFLIYTIKGRSRKFLS